MDKITYLNDTLCFFKSVRCFYYNQEKKREVSSLSGESVFQRLNVRRCCMGTHEEALSRLPLARSPDVTATGADCDICGW